MKVSGKDLLVQERMMEEGSGVKRRRGKWRFAGRLRHCLMLAAGIPKEHILNVSDPDADDHASIMTSARHPR